MSMLNFIEQELPKTTSAIILLLSFKDTVFEKKVQQKTSVSDFSQPPKAKA